MRRLVCRVTAVLAAIGLTLVAVPAAAQVDDVLDPLIDEGDAEAPEDASGMTERTATNDHGSMRYLVHVPAEVSRPAPVFVHVHGGNETAEEAAVGSGLNAIADREGFIVVYPEEDRDNGRLGIWDWMVAAQEGREGRVASLIARIVEEVATDHPTDRDRVFVSGISAGAGIAVVVGITHPDVFSGVHAEVGCMWLGLQCLAGTPLLEGTIDPAQSGALAFQAMGDHARRQPMMVSYGTMDPNAALADQEALIEQWLVTHDWIDNGADDGSIAREPATTTTGAGGERTYTRDHYVDAGGCDLMEVWRIDGLGHTYSGTEVGQRDDAVLPTHRGGPDMRAEAYRFFLEQTDPAGPPGCRASAPVGEEQEPAGQPPAEAPPAEGEPEPTETSVEARPVAQSLPATGGGWTGLALLLLGALVPRRSRVEATPRW